MLCGGKGGGGCRRRNRRTFYGSVQHFIWIKGFATRKLKERQGRREKEKEKRKKNT